MDDAVRAALQRWPQVPAVSGWLSLTARGEWRLHPAGDARPGRRGESITNPQLLAFIGRNYLGADDGRWFFQNGPQRVYVTLDLAPRIVRLGDDGRSLVDHTQQAVTAVSGWWLDPAGTLYLQTPAGPAALLDRDLVALLPELTDASGQSLDDALQAADSTDPMTVLAAWHERPIGWLPGGLGLAPLQLLPHTRADAALGFVRDPGQSILDAG